MARLHHNQQFVYLDSAGQGGEGVVSEAFATVAQGISPNYTRYLLIPPTLKSAHLTKIVFTYFRCVQLAFLIRKKNGKTPFIYSSHASSSIIATFLRLLGAQPTLCFHYHGTKVSRFSGVYKNYFKQLFLQKVHTLLMYFEQKSEYKALRDSTYVCVPSQETITQLSAIVKREYIVIPSFYDEKTFIYAKKTHTRLVKVGFVGRLSHEKGVVTLAKALSLTHSLWSKFYLTTQSGYNQHILPLIANYIPRHKVSIVKDPSRNAVAELLHSVDCVFLPSESEHFPLVMLESLATGTPFFAPPVGACNKLLKSIDSHLLLEAPTSQSIIKKLLWFSSLSHQKKAQLARKSYRVAGSFTHASFKKHVRTFLLQ